MLERNATVISIHEGRASLAFERESACGACRARGHCAGSGENGVIELDAPAGIAENDQVTVVLGTGEFALAGFLLYGLPMSGFLLALMTASFAGCADGWIGASAFAGLGLGLGASRLLARLPRFHSTPGIVQSESRPASRRAAERQ